MNAPATQESAEVVGASLLRRISVVGNTGSGKTTLAEGLARRLDCPHIELDAIHWGPNWNPLQNDLFRQQLAPQLEAERWVVDGNYGRVRDMVWARADTVIWLDYPLGLTLGRLAVRTYRRVFQQEELWNGNRERLRDHLCSRDSLFLWAIQTHRRHRREFVEWAHRPQHAHLTIVRLRTPGETERWLEQNGLTEATVSASIAQEGDIPCAQNE